MHKTLGEIAALVGGRVAGDAQAVVSSFGTIENAKEGELTFIVSSKYDKFLATSKATCILISEGYQTDTQPATNLIYVKDPYVAMAQLLKYVADQKFKHPAKGISPLAYIHENAQIDDEVYIGPFAYVGESAHIQSNSYIYPHCYIGENCQIGQNTILYPRVTLYPGVIIGNNTIVHAGAVLGTDGFGFAPNVNGYEKIPQIGNVVIGNNVEIGANTCIDRAALESTVISDGVKMDNLIQVGHNCTVGEHTVMSAQTGLAGSTHLGKWCMTAGQTGFAGHITIGDHCEMGGQSGIMTNLPNGSRVMGTPAMDAFAAMKSFAVLPKLPQLMREFNQLKKQFEKLEKEICNNTPSTKE